MHKTILPTALAFLFLPAIAAAGEAEICYTPPQPSIPSPPPPTNATVFNCPTIGARTLPQLATQGWEVVQLTPVIWDASDPINSTQSQQLVIQKP